MKYSCSACQFRRTAATSLKAARCPTRLQILGNLLPSSQRQCRHHEEESPNGANRKKKGEDFLNVSYVTIMQDKTWVYCKSVTVAENLIQAYGVCLPGCWKQRQSKSHRCTSRLCCGVCIFCQRRETFRAIYFLPLFQPLNVLL